MKKIPHQPLLFFDGVCNLCNSSIQHVIKHDKHEQFKFASLQSDVVKDILLQFNVTNLTLDSILLIYKDTLYSKSSAILMISKILGGFYALFYVFIIIPKPIRDFIYDYIARNRYQWFGKQESCMIPTNGLRNRFIDSLF